MLIQVLRNENRDTLAPLCCHRSLAELEMAGTNVNDVILTRWEGAVGDFASTDMLTATIAFWPSKQLLSQLAALPAPWIVADAENRIFARVPDLYPAARVAFPDRSPAGKCGTDPRG